MNILSWNVNGIRSVQRKGFCDWLAKESPDILCVQETKAHPEQLDLELMHPRGYKTFWSSAVKRGYSGVAIFTKQDPLKVHHGFGVERFDREGRIVIAEYPDFTLLNIYFPNGKARPERLRYKMDFYKETLRFTNTLKAKGKKYIVCGDYNTAHKPIDLARPKENEKVSGFLPEERAWIDEFVAAGNVDILRKFNEGPHQYTWWDFKTGARERNVGWRIDYHFVSQNLVTKVTGAAILPHVMGSDHCPVSVDLTV
jgi:exodeoxyribonuclease III